MSKGRFTNLCQEDKGRIGELIRTLASERQQRLEVQEGSEKWEKQAAAMKTKFHKSLKLIALYQRELKRFRQLQQPTEPPPQQAIASSSPTAASPSTDNSHQHSCTRLVVVNPTVETLVQTDPILEPIGVQTDPVYFGAEKCPRRAARLRSPSPGIPLPLGRNEKTRDRSTSSKRQQGRRPVSDSDESNSSWRASDTRVSRHARISARGASTLKPPQLSLLQRYLKMQNEKRPIPGSPPTFSSRTDIDATDAGRGYSWPQPSSSSNDDGRSREFSKQTPEFGRHFPYNESLEKLHVRAAYAESSPRHKKRESPSRRPRRQPPEDSRGDNEGRRRNDVCPTASCPDSESDVVSPPLCRSVDRRNVYSSDENVRGDGRPHGNLSSWTSSDDTAVLNAPSPLRRNQYQHRAEIDCAERPSRSSPPRPRGGTPNNPCSSSDRPNSSRDADDERSGEQRNDSSSSLGAKLVKDQDQRPRNNVMNFRLQKSQPLTPVAEFPEATTETADHKHPHQSSALLPQDHNARFGEQQHGPPRPQGCGWSYRRGHVARSSSDDREISSIAESHELANVVSTSGEHHSPLPGEQKQARQYATEGSKAAPLAPAISSLKSSTADGPASRARDVHVSWDVDTTSREVPSTPSVRPPFSRDPSPYTVRACPDTAPTRSACATTTSAKPTSPILHSAVPPLEAFGGGKPATAESDSVLQASPELRHSTTGRLLDGDRTLRQSLPFLSDGFYERSMFSVIDSLEEDTHNHMRSLDAQLRRLEEHVYGMVPDELNSSRSSHHVPSVTLQPSIISSHGETAAYAPILPVA
eukprot:GEMP01005925.1.p1 GENE.GEMP01005925.1~~GEMP01005925.1.p1  ORF type:complete len:818 (+),score=176.88 GEMP01005925.1:26-2455(+)